MFVKFIPQRGEGASGRVLASYLTESRGRDTEPVVLRGDPEATGDLIDAQERLYRYTHGVLSFTSEEHERMTPEVREALMDAFEEHAFAGLERDHYDITWVLHQEREREEMHFVTPRVELETGKALNIAPPGSHKNHWEPWREVMVQQYELVDGKDPERERALKRDDGRAFTGWEDDPRESIHRAVSAAIDVGAIKNRDDVVRVLEESGVEVPRQGKDYLTVRNPDDGRRVRMRGDLYEESFRSL